MAPTATAVPPKTRMKVPMSSASAAGRMGSEVLLPYRPSPPARVESFQRILESKGVHAFVRRPRGRDIYAACGQLSAQRASANNLSPSVVHQLTR